MSHKLEVGERRSLASHYTLTTGLSSSVLHSTGDEEDSDMSAFNLANETMNLNRTGLRLSAMKMKNDDDDFNAKRKC